GPAIWGLNAGLIAAYALWVRRLDRPTRPDAVLAVIYLAAIGIQLAHFTEEYRSGFQRELPGLFGYQWSDAQFLTFNLLWLAAFALSALGVWRGRKLAYLVLWFFALVGGIGNGIAHVGLALARGGYFPGLFTAPLMLAAGIVLVRRLVA